jgi:hypothetical protein
MNQYPEQNMSQIGLRARSSPKPPDAPKQGTNANARRNLPPWCYDPAQRKVNPKPGNGRLQKAFRRAFIAFEGGELTTGDAADWGYPAEKIVDRFGLQLPRDRELIRQLAVIYVLGGLKAPPEADAKARERKSSMG